MEYNPLLNQLKLPDMDGYSNGFNINQIRNIDTRLRRIEMKMQQIRAECNCKKKWIIIILIQMITMMTDCDWQTNAAHGLIIKQCVQL